MENLPKIRSWVYHGEWLGLMATIVGCFLFVHHETVHVTERLDEHITQINRRCDEINKRADELHKEFYDLLKEIRRT
jgi:chaperonin cofactor prefoldin